jgi:uncharacterized NAD(P)/FAD-binding protein YdhS
LLKAFVKGSKKCIEELSFGHQHRRRLVNQVRQNLEDANDAKHFVVFTERLAMQQFPIESRLEMGRQRRTNTVHQFRFRGLLRTIVGV